MVMLVEVTWHCYAIDSCTSQVSPLTNCMLDAASQSVNMCKQRIAAEKGIGISDDIWPGKTCPGCLRGLWVLRSDEDPEPNMFP